MAARVEISGIEKDKVQERPREVPPEIMEIARLICDDDDPDEIMSILWSFTPA